MDPKVPEDIYKTHLEPNSKLDMTSYVVIYTFLHGVIYCVY